MKELSIEEKAKRYDEVIPQLKGLLDGIHEEKCDIMEEDIIKIFPEFKESENEDEKIREQVVYAINQLHVCECTKNKLIAWVKKQGEQKLADLPKGEDYGIDGLYAAIDILQKTLGEVEGYQTDDGILEHQCAISAVKELSKQKPVIEMKTPEESLGISSEEYDKIIDECIFGEQKPAWSEEDEKAINDIMWIIETYRKNGFNETHIQMADSSEKWLKSLKDRVGCETNCTTTNEWSKEDYNEIETIACHLDNTDNEGMAEVLRNIRDKYYHVIPQTTWKPSDEQMLELDWIAKQNEDNMIGKELRSLYQDSKKLRGK